MTDTLMVPILPTAGQAFNMWEQTILRAVDQARSLNKQAHFALIWTLAEMNDSCQVALDLGNYAICLERTPAYADYLDQGIAKLVALGVLKGQRTAPHHHWELTLIQRIDEDTGSAGRAC